MALCKNCGTEVAEDVKFCPNCGNTMTSPAPEKQAPEAGGFQEKVTKLNDTPDTTGEFEAEDINKNKAMAILAYFGPLVLIPILAAKDSRFARYHSNQGLLLLLACFGWSVLSSILNWIILAISWRLYFLTSIISFLSVIFLVLAVLGIVNAANGKAKELPVIGKFRILK